ncbi:DUF2846 domain-containing protein [Flagellimonas sp. S174]|uniref:DUF2846 domain-containing protein n=1 Tax=Flagellimonas sp. S174 TaxID=3410790 RepID=UPI003BF53E21
MKTLRNSIFVVLFILFQPILLGSESIPTGKETVTVHVYRPKKLIGFAWVFNLKLDGEKCGRIKNGDHLVFELEPGKATFSIKKKKVELNLEKGKTYYLRSFISAGVYIGSLDLVEVTESFALRELEE